MTDDAGARPTAETGVRPVRPTGHAGVDSVLSRAAELEGIPVGEHPGRYEDLHAALVVELDAESGDPVPRRAGRPEDGGLR